MPVVFLFEDIFCKVRNSLLVISFVEMTKALIMEVIMKSILFSILLCVGFAAHAADDDSHDGVVTKYLYCDYDNLTVYPTIDTKVFCQVRYDENDQVIGVGSWTMWFGSGSFMNLGTHPACIEDPDELD